jgi:hypothetical protein
MRRLSANLLLRLLLSCAGFSYKCLLAPNLHRFYSWRHCRPRVEVYSAAGCVLERSFAPCVQPANDLYLPVCCWDAHGELIPPADAVGHHCDATNSD